ncbi:hypothetical protein ACFV2U_00170 [Streptomyces sp. NPDC059697]|uniref:hypothetical protein n=1 Tax=Streptomyces sp. NPDC059697 TaxID=3346912 RepID=UPI0036BA8567
MTESSHKHVVECALTIPDRYRAFTRSMDDAWTAHRIPESVLLDLLDLGLPHRVSGSGPRFDDRDLVNLSLQLRLPSPQLRMLRFLGDCLSDNIGQRVVRTVTVAARCPDLDSDHMCEVNFAPSLMRYRTDRSATGLTSGRISVEVELPCGPPEFVTEASGLLPLIEVARELEFYHVPRGFGSDGEFSRTTGLADCVLATAHLVDSARALGIDARPVAGMFVARPFSLPHAWISVPFESGRRMIDPFFISTLARWGVLDADVWPACRIPKGVLFECIGYREPLATHNGSMITPSLVTR